MEKILKLLMLLFISLMLTVVGGKKVYALPDYGWAKTWGDPADESYAYGTATDSAGNVYVVGYFYGGTVDFNPGSGTDNHAPVGNSDAYVVKYDVNGNYLWGRTWGSTGNDEATAVAVDSSGNVYITGRFAGSALENVDFDGTAGTDYHLAYGNSSNLFITKYNANGTYGWSQTLYGPQNNKGLGIAVASDGSVYATGFFTGTVDFDPTGVTENHTLTGSYKMFLTKYNTSGTYLWTKTLGGTGSAEGSAVTVDTLGNVYVGGNFANTVDFDPTSGTDEYTYATTGGYITKYDSLGNYQWVKLQIGAGVGNVASIYGIITDSNNNIYTTGRIVGTVDFDPEAGTVNLTSNGGEDIFLQKLDPSGNYVWAKNIGGTSNERGYSIAVNYENNVYIAGIWSGTVDFDPSAGVDSKTELSDWGVSMFASVYNTSGTYLWTKITNGGQESDAYGISVYDYGVYFVGSAYGDVDFDPEGTGDIVSGAVDWGSSALVKWITAYDTTEPTVTINSIPGHITNDNTPEITGNAFDTQTNITNVEYSINGEPYQNCTADDGAFDELNEDFTCQIVGILSDGSNTIKIRATDSQSNTNSGLNIPEYSFIVDTTPPVLIINEFSNHKTTDKTPLITGNATDALTPISVVQISIDGGVYQNCTAVDGTFDELNEDFNCQIPFTLSVGSHSIVIRATDGISNINSGGNLGTYTFSVVNSTTPQDNPKDSKAVPTVDDEEQIEEEEPVVNEEDLVIDPTLSNEIPIFSPSVDSPKGSKFFDSATRWIIDLFESINMGIKEVTSEGNLVNILSSYKTANLVQEAAILTGLMTASFVYPFGFTQVFPIFSNGILNILGVLGLKKKGKPFGYVYNQRTKAPVSLAVVRIFDEAGNLVTTSVTNAYGVFKAELNEGRYRIDVSKTGFIFPSKLVAGISDGNISNLYTGGYINLTSDNLENISIPLDYEEVSISIWHKLGRKLSGFFNLLMILAFALGFIYSIYVLALAPSLYNWLVIVVYIISAAIYGGVLKDSFRTGKVKLDGKSVEGVKISLRRLDFDKVVDSRYTDDKGNYKFIVTPGEYEIFVDDKRFIEENYEKTVFEVVSKVEVIYRNIRLKKA